MIKKLMASIREYKKESLLTPLFVTLEVILEVLIPFFMAGIIDIGLANADMPYTIRMGIILVVAAALSLICGALSGKYASIASSGFAKNLRKDMFYRIQGFSFANIDKFSTESLVTRLTTDVTNVQNAYQMIIRILIRGPVMLIFALVMAMGINMRLSMIFLVAIPILGFGLFYIAIKAHPHFEKVFRTYDNLNGVVREDVSAIRTVKSYVRENYEINLFKKISEKVYDRFVAAEKIVAWNAPLMQFTMYFAILLISWLAGELIVQEEMTTGQLMSMIVYATQILSSLMMLSMVFVMIIIASSSARRIIEVLSEESDLRDPENPVETVADGSIDFENVNFSYSKDVNKCALHSVTLHIKSGETIGIIGSTGSAKSTLVQLIPRLYDTTTGTVKVGGRDVKEYGLDALRSQVAMVLQKNMLFSGTIKENLRWGNENATDEELKHACILSQADEFVSSFPDGYDTYIEQGGTNVSGGQKQRLCIARALLKNPKILILDDSTSAVDTKTDALIRKAFREDIPNTTKIIIAQRISSVEDADKVIVMDSGRVDAFDTPENLLKTNRIYKEVYDSQKKGGESK